MSRHDDRSQARPRHEDRAREEQDDPGPEVGVHPARLLVGLVAEEAHQREDDAVEAEQGSDEVADVEGAGRVPLHAGAVGVRSHPGVVMSALMIGLLRPGS